jgi:DNA ligase 1
MILSILNEVAADSSKLAKEAILRREQNNELLKKVFKAAYDPTINYFIKKIPDYMFEEDLGLEWALGPKGLGLLTSREVTGHDAISHLKDVLERVNADDAVVLERIILRDLRCGCSESTANKVWKKLIPEFSYMRCSLLKGAKTEKWNWAKGIYSQTKADSMFCNVDVYSDEVVITSRSGTIIPNDKLMNIVKVAEKFVTKGTRLHGELMVEESGKVLPRELGNGILNSIAKGGDFKNKNQRAVYVVWDQIPIHNAMTGEDYDVGYEQRFVPLQAQLANLGIQNDIRIIPFKIVYSYEEALQHYQEQVEAGLEGTIIKTREGTWKDGTSKFQIKLKVECCIDLEMVGLNEGYGKNADLFGSVRCISSDGLFEVNVSGFKDEKRKDIFDNFDKKYKGMIMSVTINNLMAPTGNKKTWSAFLPRHDEIREDKSEADSLQRIKDQFESVIKGK